MRERDSERKRKSVYMCVAGESVLKLFVCEERKRTRGRERCAFTCPYQKIVL